MTSIQTPAPVAPADNEEFHDDIIYPQAVPFLLVHLAAFAAFVTGVTKGALILCAE